MNVKLDGKFRQSIRLVDDRAHIRAIVRELFLADHVHELDAGKHGAGGANDLTSSIGLLLG